MGGNGEEKEEKEEEVMRSNGFEEVSWLSLILF